MAFPDFFAAIPPITLRDPLAELLGAADGGLIDYHYADAVRLAGHSCPTVAGAWLMTVHALRALYGDAIPVRGEITVSLPTPQAQGVTGVIASIAGLVTGAAGEGGFKGLGGQHARHGLLAFAVPGPYGLRFSRRDRLLTVDAIFRPNCVPGDPQMSPLLAAILAGTAGLAERLHFAELWQDRVRRLFEQGDDPALVEIVPRAI